MKNVFRSDGIYKKLWDSTADPCWEDNFWQEYQKAIPEIIKVYCYGIRRMDKQKLKRAEELCSKLPKDSDLAIVYKELDKLRDELIEIGLEALPFLIDKMEDGDEEESVIASGVIFDIVAKNPSDADIIRIVVPALIDIRYDARNHDVSKNATSTLKILGLNVR
jgi:hypothetical protein